MPSEVPFALGRNNAVGNGERSHHVRFGQMLRDGSTLGFAASLDGVGDSSR